jgi:PAS domain S-box-containing protein
MRTEKGSPLHRHSFILQESPSPHFNLRKIRPMAGQSVTHFHSPENGESSFVIRVRQQPPDPIELLNLASDAIIVCETDRRINFWNAGAAAMYGWSVQEALGKNIHELLKTTFPESRESVREALLEYGVWEGELTHVTKNGKGIVVTSKHVLQKDENGMPVRILEINRDITTRKLMEDELKRSQSELEKIVDQRTAALRHLSSQLMHVQDTERRRIARELHDSVGQYLAASKMQLNSLACHVQPEGREILATLQEYIERSLRETRTLSYLLHPPLLDESGLVSAIRWYVEGFAQRSGIEAKLDLPGDLGRLPETTELALFRILQESLTNVHRHSNSSRVRIGLVRKKQRVTLAIRDFGSGMPAQTLDAFHRKGANGGVGLAGMRERVNDLDGHFEIKSNPYGTVVFVSVPVPCEEHSR